MPMRMELVPLTTFSLQPAASAQQDTQLIKYIPTQGYVSGLLELRAASRTLAAGQSIALVLQPISRAEDEPEGVYVGGTEVVATVSSSIPTALPALVPATLVAPLPASYRLLLRGIQNAGTTVMSVTLSASLVLRES